jgi:biopolymer transport protein ExbB
MKRFFQIGLLVVMITASAALAQSGGEPAQVKSHKVDYFNWFVNGASWVGYILIVLSMISVAMIIQHFVQVRKSIILPEASRLRIEQMLQERQFRELIDMTGNDPGLLCHIFNSALVEAPNGFSAMEQAMVEALQERMVHLNAKPEILAILGNTGPLIGLYGTVLGIILAFSDIVAKGGIPEPGELAGSIGVALVATFWGLTVAIPSLVVYAIMKVRIEKIGAEALATARQMLGTFRRSVVAVKQPGATKKILAEVV